MALSF